MRFTKMEGLGNDYIYLNCLEGAPENLPELARRLSERHFGVGSDGLICVKPGRTGDFTMEMYNADGSLGAMCGNGIRCVGKYVFDKGLTDKTRLVIDTGAGPRRLELHVLGDAVDRVTVDMGPVTVEAPVRVEAAGECFTVVPADAGNPHGVIFCQDPETIDLERLGPLLECHPALGQRRNIEFVCVPDRAHLALRVWERGSGITLACGTGACAAFAAALGENRCEVRAEAALPGGVLTLEEREGSVFMSGPARTVFEGEISDPG
ncbi:MAG: diaminopimelate epimerase [Lawsonibacter sp.]|nr:diaminopimelate epimerase [Lawsonibacter sp.]